jgi:hypothetical protein
MWRQEKIFSPFIITFQKTRILRQVLITFSTDTFNPRAFHVSGLVLVPENLGAGSSFDQIGAKITATEPGPKRIFRCSKWKIRAYFMTLSGLIYI